MAYQTGTTTGPADLLTKLATFASANGWTIDDAVGSNKFAMHKGTVYVSFRYDGTLTTGTRLIGVYQALSHTPGNLPGTHPNDSGSGYNASSGVTNANLDDGRYVSAGRAAAETDNTYYFFEQDSGPAYIHVVIVRSDGHHRHFGFGTIEKFGTWTGGEYCFGHFDEEPTPTSVVWATYTRSAYLLDGRYSPTGSGGATAAKQCSTVHIEGFPGEGGSSKWGQICAAKVSAAGVGNDTAGNARVRIQGGYRGGPCMNALGNFNVNKASGFINLLPIHLWAFFSATNRIHYLGNMPDCRGIILNGISPGEELEVGSNTWVCFPSMKKTTSSGPNNQRETAYQGVAYKKVTA